MTTITLQNYLEQIDELINESKLDEAIAHCRHVLTYYPRNIAVYKLLGKAHLELRHHDDAIDLFQRVLSADPNDLVAHIALSMIHKERDEADLSLWHLERAFEIEPYNEAIREELRMLYIRFNDEVPQRLPLTPGAVARLYIKGELYQQAVQTLEPVVADVQDRLDLEVLLAEALWQGRDDQRIDAEKVCLNVLERLPNSVVANSILATIWLRTGRIGESQKYLSRVQDLACLDYKSLDAETPIGRAFLTDGAPSLPQEITLQWLDNMPVPKQVQLSSADWMSEMNMDVTGEEAVHEAEGEVVEEGESGMHSYDWMMDVEDTSSSDEEPTAVMTDWFSEEAVETAASQLPEAEDEEEVPAWLGDLSDDSPVDNLDYSFLDSESGVQNDGSSGTNWFTDDAIEAANDAMVDSDVPDWLAGLDDEESGTKTAASDEPPTMAEEALSVENEQDALSEMPDWLATDTDELTPLEADAADASSDWLGETLSEAFEPMQMSGNEAEDWLSDEPDEAGADMMKETEPEESEDDFAFLDLPSDDGGEDDWLSELDGGKGKVDEADLSAFDADDGDDDWLNQLDSTESEPDLVVEEENSNASLMSDWLLETDDSADETEADTDTAVAEGGFTDWLTDSEENTKETAEEGAGESMTSWLNDLEGDDGLDDLSSAETPLEAAGELDADWLNETTILQSDHVEGVAAESMTNWLADLEEDGSGESSGEGTASIADEEPDDDWLKDTNLLEDVGGLAAAAAAAGAADWLSDEDEDEEDTAVTASNGDEEFDLFAEADASADDQQEEDVPLDDLFAEEELSAGSDWLSDIPEPSAQPAVAGDLGSNWLTEDGDDALFATSSDEDLEIPDLDSGLLSLDDDLLETTDTPDAAEPEDTAIDDADDWLSVLTQDDFDTNELKEITPEVVSDYESTIEEEPVEEETMEEEDWSALMYGTDTLAETTLDNTGELAQSDFSSSLSEEEIQNSQYDDIPDWLTSEASIEEGESAQTETKEPIHPGDMLDEDDFMLSADTSSDWEEEGALDWISDLSESEVGSSSEEDAMTPDLDEFDALIDRSSDEPISTAELLGLDEDEVPDWMAEEDGLAASAAPEAEEVELGFTDLFADADLELSLDDEELSLPEGKESAADEEDVGLTDLLGWDTEDDVQDALEELDLGLDPDTAVSADNLFDDDEEPDETLTGMLSWNTDNIGSGSEEDNLLAQLDNLGKDASSAEDADEISATDLFGEIDSLEEDVDIDDILFGDEDDEIFELEDTGLTGFLAGTSLGQSDTIDFGEDEPVANKTTAEFESELPDLIPANETSWLNELDGIVDDKSSDTKEKMSLDWLSQTSELSSEEADELLSLESESEAEELPQEVHEIEEAIFDIGEDATPEDINDAISWLEDLATQQETPIEELPSVAQNAFENDMDPFSEDEADFDANLDWLQDAEPIAEATPALEDFVEEEDDFDEIAPPDDLEGAMAWLGELSESAEDEQPDEDEQLADDDETLSEEFDDSETDALTSVQAELDDAMSWLDEISAEPEEDVAEVEETILDEEDLLEVVETEIEAAAEADDPELVDALDWLEQQVLSEGISVVMASSNAPTVSDSELDSALDWLEAQLVVEGTKTEESTDFIEEIDTDLPDANMLTGSLDEGDLNLFDRPDDPTEALAWLESMVESDGELDAELTSPDEEMDLDIASDMLDAEGSVIDTAESEDLDFAFDSDEEDDPEALLEALLAGDMEIETDLPPIKPSEDAMYVDESLYQSSFKPTETVEEEIVEEFIDEEIVAEIEESALDLGLEDIDEEDPEALFAALLAGDMVIETDLPPIKPSEDAMYVDESLYQSSSKPTEVAEEEPALDLGLEEEDPEALFAALLAGDMVIETDLPPIKPSEDAVYVDESLYASSQPVEEAAEAEITEEIDNLLDVPDDPDEAVAWLEAMAKEDGAFDIETDLPPIKPSEDAVYVDESLYESSLQPDTAVESNLVEDVPDDPDEAVAWLDKMADQQEIEAEAAGDDDAMLPSWMLGDAGDLDDNFDDILLEEEEDLTLPDIDEHATPAEILDESLGSPIDEDVHESLPSWLEVDEDNVPVGGETGWLRTLPDLDVDSWLAAEEEATVRGFDEPTPLPVTSELSPTPSLTSELGMDTDELEETLFDQPEEEDVFVVEPDSSVSMYSINEDDLKGAQEALAAENFKEASAKYNDLVVKGGGIMILIAELETVAEKHSDHPEFRRILGDAYMRNGQLQKALDTYKDALNRL